jgi:hypothetical protein
MLYYWVSPLFSKETVDFDRTDLRFIVADLRLIYSFPDIPEIKGRLRPLGRIKEQLQKELMNTLGPHMLRPGIVRL